MKWSLFLFLTLILFGCAHSPKQLSEQTVGLFSHDVDGAMLRAKSKNKPLLISFNAIWCPPCNQLEERVYESSQFFVRAKEFELLQVDADTKEAWKIKDRYKVGGYPTVVFANPSGDEIYRVVGYRAPTEFLNIMQLVVDSKGKSFQNACKSTDPDDLWRCAVTCRERKDHKCAKAAFNKLVKNLKQGSYRYEEAKIYFVKNAETEDLKRNGYERLLIRYPKSPNALVWAYEYKSLFEDPAVGKPKRKLVSKVLRHFDAMMKDPRKDQIGLTESDALYYKAELLTFLGRKKEAKKTFVQGAKLLEKLARKYPKGTAARAFALERIYFLKQAGDHDSALNLVQEYQGLYPNEFTYHYSAARLLEDAKAYPQALVVAKKAYELSYGDNRIRVGTLLVKLMGILEDHKGAKRVFEEVTRQIKPDEKLQVRTHRYLKRLNKEWEKIGSKKNS